MKNLIRLIIIFLLIFGVNGCSKESEITSTALIFTPTASISNSETLSYGLGQFGDSELTAIISQAQNAEVSELRIQPETGEVIYFYQPKAGFIGIDHVQLRTESGPLGSPESTTVMRANITIEVSF
jgi:hypothetical protein